MSPALPLSARGLGLALPRTGFSEFRCGLFSCRDSTSAPAPFPVTRNIRATTPYSITVPQLPSHPAIHFSADPSSTSGPSASNFLSESTPATTPAERYITSIASAFNPSFVSLSPASPSAFSASGSSKHTAVLAGTLAPILAFLLFMILIFVYRRRRRRRRDAPRTPDADGEAEWQQIMISAQAGPSTVPSARRPTAPPTAANSPSLHASSHIRIQPSTVTRLAAEAEQDIATLVVSVSASSDEARPTIVVTSADATPLPAITRVAHPRSPSLSFASTLTAIAVSRVEPEVRIVPFKLSEEEADDNATLAVSVSAPSEKARFPKAAVTPLDSANPSSPTMPITTPTRTLILSRAPSFRTFASTRGEPPPEYARPLPRIPVMRTV